MDLGDNTTTVYVCLTAAKHLFAVLWGWKSHTSVVWCSSDCWFRSSNRSDFLEQAKRRRVQSDSVERWIQSLPLEERFQSLVFHWPWEHDRISSAAFTTQQCAVCKLNRKFIEEIRRPDVCSCHNKSQIFHITSIHSFAMPLHLRNYRSYLSELWRSEKKRSHSFFFFYSLLNQPQKATTTFWSMMPCWSWTNALWSSWAMYVSRSSSLSKVNRKACV